MGMIQASGKGADRNTEPGRVKTSAALVEINGGQAEYLPEDGGMRCHGRDTHCGLGSGPK